MVAFIWCFYAFMTHLQQQVTTHGSGLTIGANLGFSVLQRHFDVCFKLLTLRSMEDLLDPRKQTHFPVFLMIVSLKHHVMF